MGHFKFLHILENENLIIKCKRHADELKLKALHKKGFSFITNFFSAVSNLKRNIKWPNIYNENEPNISCTIFDFDFL